VDYYNEHDPFAAAWLRELIHDKQLPPGEVDVRDIQDVRPVELAGYTQCHFFAGIGGWKLALMRAGWPDDRPVWTGSCPCQPFSAAGKRTGTADERHLWPSWFWLIQQCGPATIFGEQVASPDALVWLDIIQPDMEGAGYAVGVADMCAAGVGAPHIRQRLWFVADSASERRGETWASSGRPAQWTGDGSNVGWVADAHCNRRAAFEHGSARTSSSFQVVDRTNESCAGESWRAGSDAGGVGNAISTGLERLGGYGDRTTGRTLAPGSIAEAGDAMRPGPTNGIWRDADWLLCRDGKWRPVEPGTFPLAHGVPNRVGALRGYGNAINPEVGATFIRGSGLI